MRLEIYVAIFRQIYNCSLCRRYSAFDWQSLSLLTWFTYSITDVLVLSIRNFTYADVRPNCTARHEATYADARLTMLCKRRCSNLWTTRWVIKLKSEVMSGTRPLFMSFSGTGPSQDPIIYVLTKNRTFSQICSVVSSRVQLTESTRLASSPSKTRKTS